MSPPEIDTATLGARESEARKPAASLRDWVMGAPLARDAQTLWGLVLPAILLTLNMWRVRKFTVDDAYISFRYARNFAHGLGLVYNPGERIEGYTNFLWTVILAAGIRVGLEPDILAKWLGAAFALGALGMTHVLARRLRPFENFPCCATWLLASTVVFSGYAVFGLETAFFTFLVLSGIELFFREEESFGKVEGGSLSFPYSGVVFGLAGLTRPEAPLFLGIPMLLLGRRFFGRRNMIRAALFVMVVGAHLAFRRAYYGTWLPNTLNAKTGNLPDQVERGWFYVQNYLVHAGPLIWLSVLGVVWAIEGRRRDTLAIAMLTTAGILYVVLVGGDWMPYFRFLAPFEAFAFLLVDLGARSLLDRRKPSGWMAVVAMGVAMLWGRMDVVRGAQRWLLTKEDIFWKASAGAVATWLQRGQRGEIALGDIGYIGYVTDYPVLDLLGLVDPVIGRLPGGYTRKVGPGFADRFFDKAPLYAVLISSTDDCKKPSVPTSQAIYSDPRFQERYGLASNVVLEGGVAWCIFKSLDKG